MAEMHIRLSESTKSDFQMAISQLGYRNNSEAIRDMIEIVAYNGERTPKEQFLSRQLLRLKESLISPEATQKIREDFLEFLKKYNYLIYFARMTAEEFCSAYDLDDSDCIIYQQFYHLHGYSITPMEARQLIKHMYHDADALQEVRQLMNQMMAVKVQTADIQDILSPAEKLAIVKEGGR